MADQEIFTGAPPSAGWWHTPTLYVPDGWRWWNGSKWFGLAASDAHPEVLRWAIATPAAPGLPIVWTWYWPENARVPRPAMKPADADFPNLAQPRTRTFIDPRCVVLPGGKQTGHTLLYSVQAAPKPIEADTDLFEDDGFDFS